MLTIALCAVLGGSEGWEDIETFAKSKKAWFDQKLSLEAGVPSNDTFRRVISRIDPESFGECFLGWVRASADAVSSGEESEEDSGAELVAIDGKTLRGSYEDGDPKAAVHMVSAWASANEMVLAQLKTDDKSNEITAIPELLALLDLNGCIVTIDAMECQKEIAEQICADLQGGGGRLRAGAQRQPERTA